MTREELSALIEQGIAAVSLDGEVDVAFCKKVQVALRKIAPKGTLIEVVRVKNHFVVELWSGDEHAKSVLDLG